MSDFTSLSAAKPKMDESPIVKQMRLVDLPKEQLDQYTRALLPRKIDLILPLIEEMAGLSARVSGYLSFLRYCLANARRLDTMSKEAATEVMNSEAERILNNVLQPTAIKDAAKDYLTKMSAGNNHVIQPSVRFKGGYDVHYLGNLIAWTAATAKDAIPSLLVNYREHDIVAPNKSTKLEDSQTYLKEKLEAYSTELSLNVLKVGRALVETLCGSEATDPRAAVKRLHKSSLLNYNYEELNDLFTELTGIPLRVEFMKNISSSTIRAVGDFFSVTPIRTPQLKVLDVAMQNRNNSGFDAGEYVSEESLAVDQMITFAFSVNLPEYIVRYITQSPETEAISIPALHNWVLLWTRRYVKPKGGRVVGGKLKLSEMPKFVLPISKSQQVTEVRRTNGYSLEKGKGDDSNMFIGANGALQYGLPTASRGEISDNINGYEATVASYLQFCFEKGLPLQLGTSLSTIVSASLGKPDDPELTAEYSELNGRLKSYGGKILSYDWDYGVILTANIADPSNTSADSLLGAAKIDPIAIADYLGFDFAEPGQSPIRKTFAESLVLMTDQTIDRDTTPSALMAYDGFMKNSPVGKIIAFYSTLMDANKVPLLDALLTQAASSLNIENLDASPYNQKFLYSGIVTNDFKFDGRLDTGLGTLLKRTVDHCAGGSELRKMIAEENEGIDYDTMNVLIKEHPHYFQASESRMADFGNLYNYLGGKVFQLACENLIRLSPKELLGNSSTFSYHAVSREIMPIATMFARFVPRAAKLLEDAEVLVERNKPDESLTVADIKVSGSVAGAQMFPHQVKTHAALRNKPAFGVLDIGAGGGKTTLGVTDIAALVTDLDEIGERIKPVIFCPDNLIKNWVDDMKIHTGNNWNMIPINTNVIDRWGYDKLEETINNAPINTIVVVGFNCLTSRTEDVVFGTKKVRISNNLEFLKRFAFDYICIDESHKLAHKTSQRHRAVKQLTTASHVKYLRLASGTLIHGRVSDIIGQASLYNGHIFRDDDVLTAREEEVFVNGEGIPVWKVDTPARARAKLSRYASVTTLKKKHWAFMLPSPVEFFFPIPLVPEDTDSNKATEEEIRMGELHRRLYDVVLNESMEELAELLKSTKKARSDEDDEEDESDSEDEDEEGSEDDVGDLDLSDEELQGIDPNKLKAYIARLERLITNPMADPLAPTVFGAAGVTKYDSTVARFVARRIDSHFNLDDWKKSDLYKEHSLVAHGGKNWLARKYNKTSMTKELLPESTRGVEPQNNPDYWREEPPGKIIVFCRYTNSVNGIYNALPDKYKKIAVKYTGEEEDKNANLDGFKTDNRIQILIANEMGISEGHNLQLASRIIRVESPWNPGDLDQSASRIFRPDPAASKAMIKSGKAGELYREVIFLDWVLCNGTLHVQKQARLIAKVFNKARFDEAENPLYKDMLSEFQLDEIPMSLEILQSRSSLQDYAEYVNAYAALNGVMNREFQDMRNTMDPHMQDIPITPAVKGSYKIQTPFIANQKPEDPDNMGLISLRQLVRHEDVLANLDSVVGSPVVTDLGRGRIAKIKLRYKKKQAVDKEGNLLFKPNESGQMKPVMENDLDAKGQPQVNLTNPISSFVVKLTNDEVISFSNPGLVFVPTTLNAEQTKTFVVRNMAMTDAQQRKLDREALRDSRRVAKEEESTAAEERRRKNARKELEAREAAYENGRKRKKNIENGKPINMGIKKVDKVPPIGKMKQMEKETELDKSISVHPAYYHGYLTLEVRSDDVSPGELKKHKFKHTGPYVYARATRYPQFAKIMDYLDDNFEYSPQSAKRLEQIQDAFETGGKQIYQLELAPQSTLPLFFATNKKKVTNRKEVRPYPIILPSEMQLAIDLATCPIIKQHIGKAIPGASAKWTLHDGHELYFADNKNDMKAKIKELKAAGFTIENEQEALSEITSIKFRAAKSSK